MCLCDCVQEHKQRPRADQEKLRRIILDTQFESEKAYVDVLEALDQVFTCSLSHVIPLSLTLPLPLTFQLFLRVRSQYSVQCRVQYSTFTVQYSTCPFGSLHRRLAERATRLASLCWWPLAFASAFSLLIIDKHTHTHIPMLVRGAATASMAIDERAVRCDPIVASHRIASDK